MSTKQVSYSRISIPMMEFDLLYNTASVSNDPMKVQSAVQRMSELSEKIITTLNSAPLNISRYFNWGPLPTDKTVDVQAVTEEVQEKLALMFIHSSEVSTQPLDGRVDPLTTPPSDPTSTPQGAQPPATADVAKTDTPKTAKDLATGFGNASANCWANSLLSMIVFVPNFRQAYDTVANYYAQKNVYDPARAHGIALQDALKAYDTALALKLPVPSEVTQKVRLAFNHFFGHMNQQTRHQIFSTSSWTHEDAYEAMQVLMGRYEQIIREQSPHNPTFSDLYCPMETKRHYRPVGEQREADVSRVARDDYSRLNGDNSSGLLCNDYQILLDMQNKGHLSFQALLTDYFRNTSVEGHDLTQYLLPNGKLQSFKLTGEARRFIQVPNEFVLTIKRFGARSDGHGYKIMTPVNINRVIALPPEATKENKPIAYELDSFIVHSGGTGGGHYICYKKIEGQWIEANDGSVRFVETSEIDQILHGQKGSTFTSYMHHYSRVPLSEQAEAIAAASNALLLSPPTAPLFIEADIEKYSKQTIDAESSVKTLGTLSTALQSEGSTIALDETPSDMLTTFRHAIWLNDKTPNVNDYGTVELEKNPKKLLEIKFPWLIGPTGTSLLDQMVAIQKKKQAIAAEKKSEAQLQAFIIMLDNPSIPDEELLKALTALPQSIQWDLHGLIYHAHKIKHGVEHVHKAEYKNKYGEVTLSGGDLRKTLTEARESVLNLFGSNIVEQLALSHRIRAEKLQYAYEKEQLQAFRELLTHYPSHDLTANQLAKAFERLEIRKELKEKLHWCIWFAHHQPNVYDYGGSKFRENPRCLLIIRDPIIAEPPLCNAGSDILTQMIALLDKESR